MSASRYFPEATDGAADALRGVVPDSSEDDMVASAHLEEGRDHPTNGGEPIAQLSSAHPTPEPDPIILEDAPLGDSLAPIDVNFDDLQPMLDLRFPEPAQPIVHVVSDTDVGKRDEILEADRVDVTNLLGTGLEHAVIASFEEMPREEFSPPLDAPVEAPLILHASELDDLQPGTFGDPALDAEASTQDASEAPEVADASAVAPDEFAFAAQKEVDDSRLLIDDTSDSASPQPAPVEDDPTSLRIAAEANATAQALENLKRVLARKLPNLTVEDASRPQDASPVQPPPIQLAASAPLDAADFDRQDDGMEEFPLPPIAGELPRRGAGFAFGSFLSGFAASWVFGAALYAYLIFG